MHLNSLRMTNNVEIQPLFYVAYYISGVDGSW